MMVNFSIAEQELESLEPKKLWEDIAVQGSSQLQSMRESLIGGACAIRKQAKFAAYALRGAPSTAPSGRVTLNTAWI